MTAGKVAEVNRMRAKYPNRNVTGSPAAMSLREHMQALRKTLKGIASRSREPNSSMFIDSAALSEYMISAFGNLNLRIYLRGSAGAETMGFGLRMGKMFDHDCILMGLKFDVVPNRESAKKWGWRSSNYVGCWPDAKSPAPLTLIRQLNSQHPRLVFGQLSMFGNMASVTVDTRQKHDPKNEPLTEMYRFFKRGRFDFACTVAVEQA